MVAVVVAAQCGRSKAASGGRGKEEREATATYSLIRECLDADLDKAAVNSRAVWMG